MWLWTGTAPKAEFESLVLREYFDYRPLLLEYLKALQELPKELFLRDPDKTDSIKYNLTTSFPRMG
ncbi:MAG: hypothetical protein ACUVTO_09875 [Candidatus Caldatribacteriaceae bacterium]